MIPPLSAFASIDHFRIPLQLNSDCHPASNISIPVQPIIAALSVHSDGVGKESLTCE